MAIQFVIDGPIKYKEIRMAQEDNDVALALMERFASDETGKHLTHDEYAALIDELDFPADIMEMWTEFNRALVPNRRGRT
jgi:hypothetical protein